MAKTRREPKPATDKTTSALTPSDIEELDRASPAELKAIMSRAGMEMEATDAAEKAHETLGPMVLKVKELQAPFRADKKRAKQLHREAFKRLQSSGKAE